MEASHASADTASASNSVLTSVASGDLDTLLFVGAFARWMALYTQYSLSLAGAPLHLA